VWVNPYAGRGKTCDLRQYNQLPYYRPGQTDRKKRGDQNVLEGGNATISTRERTSHDLDAREKASPGKDGVFARFWDSSTKRGEKTNGEFF